MLTIGKLASLLGITPKTLRHYETLGIVAPASVGDHNGYRYYSTAQFERLERVVAWRRFGVPLNEIATLVQAGGLADAEAERQLLAEQRQRLLDDIAAQQWRLAALDNWLTRPATPLGIELVELAPFSVTGLACRLGQEDTDIPALWQRFIPREHELTVAGAPDASYGVCFRDAEQQDGYLAGLATAADAPLPAGMQRLTIDGGPYVRALHHGPVDNLPGSFRRALEAIEARGNLRLRPGCDFERYDARFVGPSSPDSVIELYLPVALA
ncbi:MerR family transcriptional regulator [Neisseriaceae bacterium JH1-16]|nr:MerR family transcriptional regulator [Neisseriaceae bacterium JH1-16]